MPGKHANAMDSCTWNRDAERASAGQPFGVERAKHLPLTLARARYLVAVILSQALADQKQEAMRAAVGHESRTSWSRWLNAERPDRCAPISLLLMRNAVDDAAFERIVSMLREERKR